MRIDLGERVAEVGPARLGTQEGEFPDAGGRTIHIFPTGRANIDGWGRRSRYAPATRSGGHTWWKVECEDPDGESTTSGLAVAGLTDNEARDLGVERWRSPVVIAWSPQEWRVLTSDGLSTMTTGWRLRTAPAVARRAARRVLTPIATPEPMAAPEPVEDVAPSPVIWPKPPKLRAARARRLVLDSLDRTQVPVDDEVRDRLAEIDDRLRDGSLLIFCRTLTGGGRVQIEIDTWPPTEITEVAEYFGEELLAVYQGRPLFQGSWERRVSGIPYGSVMSMKVWQILGGERRVHVLRRRGVVEVHVEHGETVEVRDLGPGADAISHAAGHRPELFSLPSHAAVDIACDDPDGVADLLSLSDKGQVDAPLDEEEEEEEEFNRTWYDGTVGVRLNINGVPYTAGQCDNTWVFFPLEQPDGRSGPPEPLVDAIHSEDSYGWEGGSPGSASHFWEGIGRVRPGLNIAWCAYDEGGFILLGRGDLDAFAVKAMAQGFLAGQDDDEDSQGASND
ncbi:DUF3293 domain-containing protein [Sphaerisporangium perillae]|uniref:DUF3293 domain-containing protein n=1 Tax=Sphaerisporangium perillae TaxID=2935860 RepID=UPI00200F94D0|nr:DUF3293 domain-containing protein [Sphaerisporangium perillae]